MLACEAWKMPDVVACWAVECEVPKLPLAGVRCMRRSSMCKGHMDMDKHMRMRMRMRMHMYMGMCMYMHMCMCMCMYMWGQCAAAAPASSSQGKPS